MSVDMIRPGIALYGYCPAPGMDNPGLNPVMTVKSRIAVVRTLPAGLPDGLSTGFFTDFYRISVPPSK